MNTSAVHASRYLKLMVLGILLVSAACNKRPSSGYPSLQNSTAVAPIKPMPRFPPTMSPGFFPCQLAPQISPTSSPFAM